MTIRPIKRIELHFSIGEDQQLSLLESRRKRELPYYAPYQPGALERILKAIEQQPGKKRAHEEFLGQVGRLLFNALISGDEGISRELSGRKKAPGSDPGRALTPVLLQLRFDPGAVEPAQLPWELMRDEEGYPVLDGRTWLTRYVSYFGDRGDYAPVEKLRVLYVISRPRDQEWLPEYLEKDSIAEIIRGLVLSQAVEIDVITEATTTRLKLALQRKNYHVLHFDGHGGLVEDQGQLCFEDAHLDTDYVSAGELAELLKIHGIKLVILSACQSGMVRGKSIYNSFGPRLIRADIPAVIAMQFTIPIGATVLFAREFYRSIGNGESIVAAVSGGRQEIARQFSAWFHPAVYLRAADGEGYLFSPQPQPHAAQRRYELSRLAREWMVMTPALQALYHEGAPLWHGYPIPPDLPDPFPEKDEQEHTDQQEGSQPRDETLEPPAHGADPAPAAPVEDTFPPSTARPYPYQEPIHYQELERPPAEYGNYGEIKDLSGGTLATSLQKQVYENSILIYQQDGEVWRFREALSRPDENFEYFYSTDKDSQATRIETSRFGTRAVISGDTLVISDPEWSHGDTSQLLSRMTQLREECIRLEIRSRAMGEAGEHLSEEYRQLGRRIHEIGRQYVGYRHLLSMGCVNVYTRRGEKWVFQQKVYLPDHQTLVQHWVDNQPDYQHDLERKADGEEISFFGHMVAVDGAHMLVSAWRKAGDYEGNKKKVYAFTRRKGRWEFNHTLDLPPSGRNEPEEYVMSLSGNWAVLGSPYRGSAYFYRLVDGRWTSGQRVDSSLKDKPGYDAHRERDFFGAAVRIEGPRMLIGSSAEVDAWLYELHDGQWNSTQVFRNENYDEQWPGSPGWENSHMAVDRDPNSIRLAISGDTLSTPSGFLYKLTGDRWTRADASPGNPRDYKSEWIFLVSEGRFVYSRGGLVSNECPYLVGMYR